MKDFIIIIMIISVLFFMASMSKAIEINQECILTIQESLSLITEHILKVK